MKYKTNLLGACSVFHEMLMAEFEEINKTLSRKIMKDLPILNSLDFYLDDDGDFGYIYRTKDGNSDQIILENKEEVSLPNEDIEVYFEFSNKKEVLDEYPNGLTHEFLEIKEPNLFFQLKQLQFVRNSNLEEIIKNSLKELLN